jgi:predicted PurR-regulated permease PerM
VTASGGSRTSTVEEKSFLFLVIAVSLAFAWILRPFYGAVLWGVIIAVVFRPLYLQLLRRLPGRPTIAALATVLIILVMVILPMTVLGGLLVQEAVSTYDRIQSGELNVGRFYQQVLSALPDWVRGQLERVGLTSLGRIEERLSALLTRSAQFLATQALNIGQNAADFLVSLFVMLYLLFFLVRDGDAIARRIRGAAPLRVDQQRSLADRFSTVVRATVKGNFVVALVQGALGGLIFWILGVRAPVLWGTLMALLSLLPAVGTAIVWLPVAIFFLASGAVAKGIILIVFGVLVIGLVDNILRPMLVGKDTKMPDYVVLISTLGGIAVFGLNGFVIGPLIAAMFITVWDTVAASKGALKSAASSAAPAAGAMPMSDISLPPEDR